MSEEQDDEYQEITQIGRCVISVNRRSDIRIECEEPITKLDIDQTDLKLVSGISDTVEKYADVVKKNRKEE